MSASEALELFAILTIGDGLVSQIPALFIAITAGIIVTRVSPRRLGRLGLRHWRASHGSASSTVDWWCAAGLVRSDPGFPKITFLVLALVVGGGGFTSSINRKSKPNQKAAIRRALSRRERVLLPQNPINQRRLVVAKANWASKKSLR